MRIILLFLLSSAAFFLAAAPRKTFTADFENGDAGRNIRGEPVTANQRGSAPSRRMEGISGYGTLVSPSTPLSYPANGIVNPLKGSLSFWVKPLDWDGECKEFRPVFWLGGAGCSRVLYYLLVTGRGGIPQASCFTRATGRELVTHHDILDRKLFAKNQWTFVVINWNAWQIELFLNGRSAALLSYSLPLENLLLEKDFQIWFGNHLFWGKKYNYSSVFDEISVYDDIRTPHDIEQEYLKHTLSVSSPGIPLRATVPAGAPPEIDGQITGDEWEHAVQIPLAKEFFTGNLTSENSTLKMRHDRKKIYFLFETDAFAEVRETMKNKRSREVFTHDAFEIILRPQTAKKHTEPFLQIAASPAGCWAMQNRGDWTSRTTLEFAASQSRGKTFVELSLPIHEVDPDFRPGKIWQAEFGYTVQSNPLIPSQQARVRGWAHVTREGLDRYSVMYHYPEAMGELKLGDNGNCIQLKSLGRLLYGTPSISMQTNTEIPLSVLIRDPGKELFAKEACGSGTTLFSGKINSAAPLLCSIRGGTEENPEFYYETKVFLREQLQISSEVFPDVSRICLMLDASGFAEKDILKLGQTGMPGTAVLYQNSAPHRLFGKCSFSMTARRQNIFLPFRKLTKGDYTIAVTLDAPDGKIEKQLPVTVPEDDFLHDKTGLKRSVPAPWTPVAAPSEHEIRMIGREYRFNPLGLPERVKAWGRDVLASEVEFIIRRNNRDLAFEPEGPIRATETSPDRVIHEGTAFSPESGIRIRWKRTAEFDGMVLYRLEIPASAKAPLSIDGIRLRFQVRSGLFPAGRWELDNERKHGSGHDPEKGRQLPRRGALHRYRQPRNSDKNTGLSLRIPCHPRKTIAERLEKTACKQLGECKRANASGLLVFQSGNTGSGLCQQMFVERCRVGGKGQRRNPLLAQERDQTCSHGSSDTDAGQQPFL